MRETGRSRPSQHWAQTALSCEGATHLLLKEDLFFLRAGQERGRFQPELAAGLEQLVPSRSFELPPRGA